MLFNLNCSFLDNILPSSLAKTLPIPPISKIEYELKDELIRQTIMDTQEDVKEIKETLRYICSIVNYIL